MCLVIRVLKENSRKALGLLHRSLSNQDISERQLLKNQPRLTH